MIQGNQKNVRILVVEDECIVAEDLKGCLSEAGYEVIGTAATGEEALRIADQIQPDLALLDVNLAGAMDGTDTARALQEMHGTPVLYLTAYSDDRTIERMKPTKPRGYLMKPFREKELLCSIDLALTPSQGVTTDEYQQLELLDQFPIAVILTDSAETIRYSNQMAQQLFGNSEYSKSGNPIATVFQQIDMSEQRELVEWCVDKPMTIRFLDVSLSNKMGETVPLEITVSPYNLTGEDNPMLLFMFLDRRGEEVRIQQQLQEQTEEFAVQKKEAINDFLSGVSHGVNNSLSGALGYLYLLKEQRTLSEEEEQWISCIEEGCRDAAGLLSRVRGFDVRDVLAMHEDVCVTSFVRDVVETMRNETPHTIALTLPDTHCTLQGNSSLLRRVLTEIIENATQVSAVEAGPIDVSVRASACTPALSEHTRAEEPYRLVIEVRDCGPGVSRERQQRMFDPFYTSVPNGNVYSRGLGLFVASSIMDCHQGYIECENRPGSGAIVRLVFSEFSQTPF